MRPQYCLIAALLTAAACGGEAAQTAPAAEHSAETKALISQGRAIVSAECLQCHALATGTDGPRIDAPALSTVLDNYAGEALFDDFRMGIHLGAEDMPVFDFTVQETDALLAFLNSIAAHSGASDPGQ